MKIDKKFKGLKDVGWRYEYEGSIVTEKALEVDLDMGLYVSGYIKADEYIEAGGFIEAGEYIKAGGYIEADRSIKAGWYIGAGEFIRADEYIEAGEFIKADWYIKAGEYIKADEYIKAGEYIEAGGSRGISAGLYINCKGVLKFGGKCFAGICVWREITDKEKTITCGKLEGGTIEYGILVETGLENERRTELLKKADELIAKAEELKQEAEKI